MPENAKPAVSVDAIDALLPQTQCQRCGYAACRPYAEALAAGKTSVNLCPPGGEPTRAALAELLNLPLEPAAAIHSAPQPAAAFVIEPDCIGCTKCIQVCPTDAIVGAANLMHSVVPDWCSGCELCVPVCPTDCIVMNQLTTDDTPLPATAARERYLARQTRLDNPGSEPTQVYVELDELSPQTLKADIEAALARNRPRA